MSTTTSKKKEYDYLFKVVIVGNSNVGKSSLLMRFADDKFKESYLATIGVDFRFKTIEINQKNIKLQIWDTAGQERFRTITNAYYKGADGIILVFDKTNKQSYDDINGFWMNEVESYGEKNVSLLLLGNKSDLDDRQITIQEAQKYATDNKMLFFETSAKTAESVDQAFQEIAKQLVIKREEKRKQRNELNSTQQADPVALAPVAGQEENQEKNDQCSC